MKKNRLYTVIGILCAAGYSWLFFARHMLESSENFSLCFFKNLFGIPCPTCGSTRAVLMLAQGDFPGALLLNPIGIVIAVIMIIMPVWLVFDLLTKRQTLFLAYRQMEQTLRIKWVAAILALLIIANWIWNFYKPL